MALQYLPSAIFLVLVFTAVKGDVYLVAPDVADCNVSTFCNTLSYYASSTAQQLSDSVFYFMPGTHLLQQVWIIENASNLTLTGRSPIYESEQETIIECTSTSNTHRGIRVINGWNIALKNMEILHCEQDTYGISGFSSALYCGSTNNLQLSNLTIRDSKISQCCLQVKNCTDFVITDSEFANSYCGILIKGMSSGNLTSINLTDNQYGMYAKDDTTNLTTIHLSRINACNNSLYDFAFELCSAEISVRNYISRLSGGFYAKQECKPTSAQVETYVIEIQKCVFTAPLKGISVHVLQAQNLEISIISCSISDTSESVPGIYLTNTKPTFEEERHDAAFTIEDVTIENVNVSGNPNPVLRVYSIQQVYITNLSILNNGHGGLVLDDSVAVFRGTNTFRNNWSINGGGIALYGNSYILIVDSTTTMEFINNKAERLGGGIFVSQDDSWIKQFCFMQLDAWPNVSFQGNTAGYAGTQLYGGSIDSCKQAQSLLKLDNVFKPLISATQCSQTEVSSDAVNLTFCDDDGCINTTASKKIVRMFPGTTLTIIIAAIGQLDGLTQATVLLTYDEVFEHETADESQFINASCTKIIRDIRAKRTNTKGGISLTLFDDFISVSTSEPIIHVVVDLLPCPPGFSFSEEIKTCICADSIKKFTECSITSQTITRNDASWIFPTNESITIFEHCPFDYCNTEPISVYEPDDQCNNNRSGILCGDCIRGYSLTLGSNECWNCVNQLWKLPIILLASALAGIGLVTVLIVLNLTVSVGTINGLLLFVNVVKIYESTFFIIFFPFWNCLLSWLNLDLGVTTCFYEGMDACQKVGLQFVFPMYLILLVMAIVAVCRCGQWIGLRSLPWVVKLSDKTALLMGSKIIPVLATLLLFSYTKLIRSTILIYHKADIQVFDSNPNISDSGNNSRWYVNGSVEYLTGCHSVLFGLGTGIIVPLISLFTAFLLFFPLMERYLPRFKLWSSWHMRLKPWYDAYGGPYKDEYRFWTGFLLLVRCLLVVVVTVSDDPYISSSVLMWVCLILIPIIALLQVYKSSILNVLEIIYLSSILAMLFLSNAAQNVVQLSLVLTISLCLLVAILLFHTGQRLKPTWLALFLRQLIANAKNKPNSNEKNHLDNKDKDAGKVNISASTVRVGKFNELREPLLEDTSDSYF